MGESSTVIFARGNNLIALSRAIINGVPQPLDVNVRSLIYADVYVYITQIISIEVSRVNNNKSTAITTVGRDSSHLPDRFYVSDDEAAKDNNNS